MSAEVETMFSVRQVPWHGLGTIVQEAPTSLEALKLAGLDWDVLQQNVCLTNGNLIPGVVANVRSTDNKVLGVVTPKYKVVQNTEAFDFTDSLIGENLRYETAGSLFDGKQIWLLAKMPTSTILGDDVEPYICFTNSHDGKGSVHVCMTPIRVVCNNTLNLALSGASKQWSTRHLGDIKLKMSEAQKTLELANVYMESLSREAEVLANTNITTDKIVTVIGDLFPKNENMTARAIQNIDNYRSQLLQCLDAPDIKQFANTQWGVVQGVADFMSHAVPNRRTTTFDQRRFSNILTQETILDKTYKMLKTA